MFFIHPTTSEIYTVPEQYPSDVSLILEAESLPFNPHLQQTAQALCTLYSP